MSIEVHHSGAALGHEIRGVDIAAGVSDTDFAQIEKAFDESGVVVIRGQQLTPEQQIAFSRRFGELEAYPVGQFILPGHPEILVVSNILEDGKPIGMVDAGRAWHSDMAFTPEPPRCSLLYSLEVPQRDGQAIGDTLFANTSEAWQGLSTVMKDRLAGLTVHNSFASYATKKTDGREKLGHTVPDVIHPLVRTHPATGRKCLYISERLTVRIGDLDENETARLRVELMAHMTKPEYVYRHQWRVGDLVIWDNCASIHKAVFDYALPQRRRMHRTTVKGGRPF
jgi:taurine dioxygenase